MTDFELPIPDTSYEQIRLEHLQVGASYVASRAFLERSPSPGAHILDALQFQLRSYVLADHLVRDTYAVPFVYSVPASWWQHFKLTYGHQWWLRRFVRRWPAKSDVKQQDKTVTFDRYATYPDARIRTPDLGPVYILEQVTHD